MEPVELIEMPVPHLELEDGEVRAQLHLAETGGVALGDHRHVRGDVLDQRAEDPHVVRVDHVGAVPFDHLVQQLAQLGVKVARRTITKYRKKMGIGSSRQRRQWN